MGYDDVGNLAGYTYPNGVSTTLQYDGLNRLTSLGTQSPLGAIASYVYSLGAAGNRTGVTELNGRQVTYGYDNLYRLTSETITGAAMNGVVSYTYDAVGNRKQITSTLAAIPASGLLNYDANDRTTTDTYDANGNIVSQAGIADSYDFENHLIQHGYIVYVYDGDGNRVAKTIGGVTSSYLVDTLNPTGYTQVLDELQSSSVVRSYTWGLQLVSESQLVAATPPASPWVTNWYGFDGHGSVRYLTNSTGVVTDTYDYDAFGNLINSTGRTANNYLFAGEQFDPDLGLYYNRARYLDVRAGRFWGMDTYEGDLGAPLSLHKYLYTGANPANHRDPSGNDFDTISTLAAAADSAVLGAIAGLSVSAGLAIASVGLLADNLPKDAFQKPSDGTVIGFQLGWNPSGALSSSDNPFLYGLALGLQFFATIGGLELVHKDGSEDVWAYGYLGATAGYNAASGNPLLSGRGSPYAPFGVLGNSAIYAGNVWNLNSTGSYEGPTFCASATPRLRAIFPYAPVQVGGTVCSGIAPPGGEATYTYTVGVSPNSGAGTSVQAGTEDYYFIEAIPIKQLRGVLQ
jgi:RHS repeat-associated protein